MNVENKHVNRCHSRQQIYISDLYLYFTETSLMASYPFIIDLLITNFD